MHDCQVSTLADGSQLITYATQSESNDGDPAGFRTVNAKRVVGDLVLWVWAGNGVDSPDLHGSRLPNLPKPVLSTDQVQQLVSQPWWGTSLPARFAGADLPSYEQFGPADGALHDNPAPAAS
jgi:hypothetical protein